MFLPFLVERARVFSDSLCGSILSAGSRSELRGVDTRHFEVRRVLLGHRPLDFFKIEFAAPIYPPSGRLFGPSIGIRAWLWFSEP